MCPPPNLPFTYWTLSKKTNALDASEGILEYPRCYVSLPAHTAPFLAYPASNVHSQEPSPSPSPPPPSPSPIHFPFPLPIPHPLNPPLPLPLPVLCQLTCTHCIILGIPCITWALIGTLPFPFPSSSLSPPLPPFLSQFPIPLTLPLFLPVLCQLTCTHCTILGIPCITCALIGTLCVATGRMCRTGGSSSFTLIDIYNQNKNINFWAYLTIFILSKIWAIENIWERSICWQGEMGFTGSCMSYCFIPLQIPFWYLA